MSTQLLQRTNKCWQVSSLGRLCNTYGVVSHGSLSFSGYYRVMIAEQMWYVQRVVMLAFHGLPSGEQWQVHHKDGNKNDNALENLEYVTPSQNRMYSIATSARQGTGHIQSKPVLWRMVGSQTWARCSSIKAAAEQTGLSSDRVSKCCRTNSQCKGIEFRFQELEEPPVQSENWLPMRNPATGTEVPGRLVSSHGRITSRQGVVSQGHLHDSGYYRTQVFGRKVYVHRLVAEAFLKLPVNHRVQVNHKDLNKQNNAVDNLEYVTPAENIVHFYANARCNRSSGHKPVWSKLCGSDGGWMWHASLTAAAKALGVSTSNVCRCLKGNARQAGGYEFQLAESAAAKPLPGEVWRDVCLSTLMQDKAILRKTLGR